MLYEHKIIMEHWWRRSKICMANQHPVENPTKGKAPRFHTLIDGHTLIAPPEKNDGNQTCGSHPVRRLVHASGSAFKCLPDPP
ncbi:MAG TPA: hypothetical protein DCS88_11075 [Alphaproteobacteria bacterium]|nr:hypothetical protein [Alphaproteobacteria bacterium]